MHVGLSMEIKDENIREAEILLIGGKEFDKNERVPFIKTLESCDLLAVPGSGKTTALLAKLYCLSKNLPFNDGSGILVLSHTNSAVEEIAKNLKKHCPKLFEYPNFIGTVQSFVNKFLANSACLNKYGSYIAINDNDFYEREANEFFNSLQWKNTDPKGLKNKLFGKLNVNKQNITFSEKEENIKKFIRYFELDISQRKIIYNESSFYTYNGNSQRYYIELEAWKESLYKKGVLNFKDSFYLANWYIDKFPEVRKILQNRFKIVFVDEMQDLEKFQIDIIDKVFFSKDYSTIIQRIGDVNQAIYNSGKKVKVKADWQPRNQMYLKNSYRLTAENANIVNYFTLDRQQDENGKPRFIVNGLKQHNPLISPHLVLFNSTTIRQLEPKFKELIKKYSLIETPEGKKYGFKIIGWSAKWDDEIGRSGKLRLENIFESYKKEMSTSEKHFDSLSKYLQFFDHSKTTLAPARKAILNILITVLRIEKKMYSAKVRGKDVTHYYTINEMLTHIYKRGDVSDCELFKINIYKWSYNLAVRKKYEAVFNEIKSFITNEFKSWFELSINQETIAFIGTQFKIELIDSMDSEVNEPNDNNIIVDIDTVHSAKGHTHCATMYVETSYYEYETQKAKITEALTKKEHCFNLEENKDIRGKEALKMMYVGFSRPTHLLCFACLKENITQVENYEKAGWVIIDLTD